MLIKLHFERSLWRRCVLLWMTAARAHTHHHALSEGLVANKETLTRSYPLLPPQTHAAERDLNSCKQSHQLARHTGVELVQPETPPSQSRALVLAKWHGYDAIHQQKVSVRNKNNRKSPSDVDVVSKSAGQGRSMNPSISAQHTYLPTPAGRFSRGRVWRRGSFSIVS